MAYNVHGGDIYTAYEKTGKVMVDFSANNNFLGIPQGVKEAVAQSIESCQFYPDPLCRKLTEAIAAAERIDPNWVHCGNGAADVLFRFMLAARPKRALVLAPTFSEYEDALVLVGCQVEHYILDKERDFRLDEGILAQIEPGLDMVCICNPNNPTGQLTDPALMEKILQKCAQNNILFLVDECFNDFLDNPVWHTLTPFLAEYPNLFILKAFTKFYAIAGLRLGYGLCSNGEFLTKVANCGQPWSVSIPAQAAGIAALKEGEYQVKTRKLLPAERSYLVEKLEALGLKVYRPRANYIFFQAVGVVGLQDSLAQEGILIRCCGNYRILTEDYYRIAVRTREENDLLLAALGRLLGKMED